ncbi:MAG: NAD(P)-dependent oxidoreductase [Acidimicrobiaceae bacterium]|nr:NAD(P)-dependent oxidoreductase [Acidimicrobiaceae bacterium]
MANNPAPTDPSAINPARPATPVIGVLGLGEAGGEIARNVLEAGAVVRAYDPNVGAPPGAVACSDEADAASGAEVVLNVNSSHDAEVALTHALPGLRPGMVWAELNTSSAKAKQHLASLVADAFPGDDTVFFADVAIMSPVPGTGVRTPMLAAGPGAKGFVDLIGPLGGRIEVLDEPVGAAATKKLLRSVFFKGMSMAVVEALVAARAAGLEDWLHDHIRDQLAEFDDRAIERIVEGSYRHARRRADEMEAASDLLTDLGVPPLMAGASQRSLAAIAAATAGGS